MNDPNVCHFVVGCNIRQQLPRKYLWKLLLIIKVSKQWQTNKTYNDNKPISVALQAKTKTTSMMNDDHTHVWTRNCCSLRKRTNPDAADAFCVADIVLVLVLGFWFLDFIYLFSLFFFVCLLFLYMCFCVLNCNSIVVSLGLMLKDVELSSSLLFFFGFPILLLLACCYCRRFGRLCVVVFEVVRRWRPCVCLSTRKT